MVIQDMFNNIYKNKTVLVTGHTGFKGSWLTLWLTKLGAKVIGYSLKPPTTPNHFELLKNLNIISIFDDIRNFERLNQTFKDYNPNIVFHLAAQPIVRYSYQNPIETFETNVLGTVYVFEASRKSDSVRAIINITSDKCYKNKEWCWGYREDDQLGGYDPYSASKSCAELISSSYRNSFFNGLPAKVRILLANARAGNVIGGGDWAPYRLIPDLMRASNDNKKALIRNPNSTRPWQHVLEPLSGYLLLGWKLLENKQAFSDAWNFGPSDTSAVCVEDMVNKMKEHWDKVGFVIKSLSRQPYESIFLKLDCSKAFMKLKWRSVWNLEKTIKKTVDWYRKFYEYSEILSSNDLSDYINDAKIKSLEWTK